MGKSFYGALNGFALQFSRGLAVLGFLVLVAMAVWILIDVFSGIFRLGLPGMVDWVEVLNVLAIALPLAYVTLQRKHITMTLLDEHISARQKKVLNMIVLSGFFLYSAMLSWRLSLEALYSVSVWEKSEVGINVYWFPSKVGLAFSFLMMAFSVLIQLIGEVTGQAAARGKNE